MLEFYAGPGLNMGKVGYYQRKTAQPCFAEQRIQIGRFHAQSDVRRMGKGLVHGLAAVAGLPGAVNPVVPSCAAPSDRAPSALDFDLVRLGLFGLGQLDRKNAVVIRSSNFALVDSTR